MADRPQQNVYVVNSAAELPEQGDQYVLYQLTYGGAPGVYYWNGSSYVQLAAGGGGGSTAWGGIIGTLSDQTDLQAALDTKIEDAPANGQIYGRADNAWTAVVQQIDQSDLDAKQDRENGFVDRAESTVTFDDGTRTLTIAPVTTEFNFWQAGALITKTGAENIVIDDVEGLHFVYYEGPVLRKTTTFDISIIVDFAFVAVIYWDAANSEAVYFGDERHGAIMDSQTHVYNHLTFGARYGNGLTPGNLDVDGNGDDATAAQMSIADGEIWDEDIQVTITGGSPQTLAPIAQIPVLYQTGNPGNWRKVAATQYPITTTGSGRAAYNLNTAGTWSLAEVPNNDFVLAHIFATPSFTEPMIAIMGQDVYSNLGNAREGANVELANLVFGELSDLTPEYVPVATFIFQTSNGYSNAVKSRIRSTEGGDDYIDWRGGVTGSGGTASDPTWGQIVGTLANQTDLQGELDGKADTVHTHVEADITNLGNYTEVGHTHVEADITDLQAYAALAHTHVEADITDLGAYLTDAPSNGNEYVRKDGAWAVASGGGGGGAAPEINKYKGTATGSMDDTELTLTWAAAAIDQIGSDISLVSSNAIQNDSGGNLTLKFTVALRTDNGNRTELFIRTYIDPDGVSGYTQDTDEVVSDYVSRDSDQDTGTVVLSTALTIANGGRVQFRGFGDTDGSCVALTAGTRLLVEKF